MSALGQTFNLSISSISEKNLLMLQFLLVSLCSYFFICSLNECFLSNHHAMLCSVSCPTLQPHDCKLLDTSVHEIFQARILEWVAISSSRRSSWFSDWTHVSCISFIGRQILYHWTTWETQLYTIKQDKVLGFQGVKVPSAFGNFQGLFQHLCWC